MKDSPTSAKIIFFGTPEFAVPSLQSLIDENIRPNLVVTQPDRPRGRKNRPQPSPVKTMAQKHGLEVYQPQSLKTDEAKNYLKKFIPDLYIVAAYGKIIPLEVLNIATFGALNLHPSLLPKYRGPAPIQACLVNGDEETGLSIIKLNQQMDQGPIIAQKKIKIAPDDNYLTLSKKLAQQGGSLLTQVIVPYISQNIPLQNQDDQQATFTRLLKKEDGQIDWSKPAAAIHNQIRAFMAWPKSYTFFTTPQKNVRLSVLESKIAPISTKKPGQLFNQDQKLFVGAGQGSLELLQVQLEGGGKISGQDFVNGYNDLMGTNLLSKNESAQK